MIEDHLRFEGVNSNPGFRESDGLEGWARDIEDHLEQHISYMKNEYGEPVINQYVDQENSLTDFISGMFGKNDEHATREDLRVYVDEIHDAFEEIYDFKVREQDREVLDEHHIYDESLGYKLKETVKNDDFILPTGKGAVGSGLGLLANGGLSLYIQEDVYNATGDYSAALEASKEVMSYWPATMTVPLAAGVFYGLWNSWDGIRDDFSGRYHKSGKGLGSSFTGEATERRIAIEPGTTDPIDAFGVAVSENAHLFQDLSNSPSFYEFLLNEGTDAASVLAVFDREPDVPKLTKEEISEEKDYFELRIFAEAYASIKNNGAESVDPMTFTSVGLDPETSTRLAKNTEKWFEQDYSEQHFYSGSIGGALLRLGMEEHDETALGDMIRGDVSKIPHLREAEELDFLQDIIQNGPYDKLVELEQ